MLGGRCGRNNMFFEGKRCWEKYNSGCLRGFDVKNSCYVLETFPTRPLPTTEGLNFALRPHPNWPVIFGYIRLLGNFPISQVAGCRCTLLARNSSISLAGSEEQMHFSQQSPKMLK